MSMLEIARLRNRGTARFSSYDTSGRNGDAWVVPPGESRVLADIKGPAVITHIWMTQGNHYRQCLLRMTWDDAPQPSVLCPLGDFFGLGHGIVNSYQSFLFSASTHHNNRFEAGCALNCYVPMPFRKRALIELLNESSEAHGQYFYVDYETVADEKELDGLGYFHAEFRRTNPFGGWAPEIIVNTPEADVANKERIAWENNYVILETRGRGHYVGCNLSVANFQGTWWGEGDDMIWVDGYRWPPDLHGTGSEDFLNQAWGMQPNAFLRNGSSIFEGDTIRLGERRGCWSGEGGYQSSYVHYIENPVRFTRGIKVTIEHGHANHLANDMCSVAYWYAEKPTPILAPPPVAQRMPVRKEGDKWVFDRANQCPGKPAKMTDEMRQMKAQWRQKFQPLSSRHSPFVAAWKLSKLLPPRDVARVRCVRLADKLDWRTLEAHSYAEPGLVSVHSAYGDADGLAYLGNRFKVDRAGTWTIHLGHDGPAKLFVDGRAVLTEPVRVNPAPKSRSQATVKLTRGTHEVVLAFDTDGGQGWGFYFCFEAPKRRPKGEAKPQFPSVI